MLYIGCHLSSSGGYTAMGKTALSIGANVFQYFTRNPRGGAAKPIDPKDAEEYMSFSAEHGLGKILAHAPYTVNPCAADERVLTFARETFADDLQRLEYVPGNYYNFHPGSHVKQGIEKGIELIAETLDIVMFEGMKTTVLLETMAGKGTEVGSKFEELKEIMNRAKYGEALGVCLDTCHVFDAGYDIVNNLDGVLDEFDRVIGLDRLKAIHLNDSKNPYMSHKDRHEIIGGGSLGLDTVTKVINNPRLKGIPFYLETPNDLEGYGKEI